jgi:hypothetical protein
MSIPAISPDRLYDERWLAEYLGVSRRTTQAWRVRGDGPVPHIKLGAAVRYLGADILAAVEAGRRLSTSDVGGAL